MQQSKSEKEELLRLRKIASSIAKEVKHFWDSIRKVSMHIPFYTYISGQACYNKMSFDNLKLMLLTS